MTCKVCGNAIPDGSKFCITCGSRQDSAAEPAVDSADLRLGTTLEGKYRIESRIGAGGMATVYLATRLLIGDQVAIKILHAEQLKDPQASERFRREAQAAARLKHQNAVSIYDFGVSDDGTVYLVMEFVEGESLRQLIKNEGPLLPSVVHDILSQVCAALGAAHTQNIIHRDIKPDNILVSRSQSGLRVKVLDFGIARLRDLTLSGSLTQTGSVLGTPHYMSPEQGLGEELDGRSDIYSLGIVLYEMLTGVVPFNAPTSVAVVVQHVNATPVPVRVLNASVPPTIEAVVSRALAKRREDRPQTAVALASEFGAAVARPALAQVVVASSGPYPTPGLMPTVRMATPASSGVMTSRSDEGLLRTPLPSPVGSRSLVLTASGALVLLAVAGIVWFVNRDATSVGSAEAPSQEVVDRLPQPEDTNLRLEPPTVPAPREGTPESPTAVQMADPPELAGDRSAPAPPPGPRAAPAIAVGTLTILAPPASAVRVGDRDVGVVDPQGVLVVPGVQPGQQLVRVRRQGYAEAAQTVTISPGQARVVEFTLQILPGVLRMSAAVEDVTVVVDDSSPRHLPIDGLALPAGIHRVTASKNGYRKVEERFEIKPDETTTLRLAFEKLSVDELLRDAQRLYDSKNYDGATRAAQAILDEYPDSGEAYTLLGRSAYGVKDYQNSLKHFRRSLDSGQTVELPARHRHGGLGGIVGISWCDGVLSLSKTAVSFRSSGAGHSFSIPSSKLLSVEQKGQIQLDTKIRLPNGDKERDTDFDFLNLGTVVAENKTFGVQFECRPACDGSLGVLGALLMSLKGS